MEVVNDCVYISRFLFIKSENLEENNPYLNRILHNYLKKFFLAAEKYSIFFFSIVMFFISLNYNNTISCFLFKEFFTLKKRNHYGFQKITIFSQKVQTKIIWKLFRSHIDSNGPIFENVLVGTQTSKEYSFCRFKKKKKSRYKKSQVTTPSGLL